MNNVLTATIVLILLSPIASLKAADCKDLELDILKARMTSAEKFDFKKVSKCLVMDGSAEAHYLLGIANLFGINTVSNIPKANKYLTLAASKQHIEASRILGSMYTMESPSVNFDLGIDLLEFAVSKGSHEASVVLIQLLHDGKYNNEIFVRPYYEKALKAKHPSALFENISTRAQRVVQTKDLKELKELIEETDFDALQSYRGETHLIFAKLYMTDTEYYNFSKAVEQLKLADKHGSKTASKLLQEMNALE
jgi:TPR repeat protein